MPAILQDQIGGVVGMRKRFHFDHKGRADFGEVFHLSAKSDLASRRLAALSAPVDRLDRNLLTAPHPFENGTRGAHTDGLGIVEVTLYLFQLDSFRPATGLLRGRYCVYRRAKGICASPKFDQTAVLVELVAEQNESKGREK